MPATAEVEVLKVIGRVTALPAGPDEVPTVKVGSACAVCATTAMSASNPAILRRYDFIVFVIFIGSPSANTAGPHFLSQ